MKRVILSASIATCFVLAWTVNASGAKPGKKQQQQPTPAPSALPPKPAQPAPPEAKPMSDELPSPWRTWSDPAGKTIEAAFASLYGNIVTIQTKEGQTYQINLMNLVPADRAFAFDYAKRLRARSFANDYVKTAAYHIDFLIGTTLVKNGKEFNPPATDEQFVRRIYLDAIGRIPTAEEASTFLADTTPSKDKRAKLIDKLLYSPGYTMQMYNWMGDMLRAKDTFGKNVPTFTFQDWLKDQLHADRTWDSLVRTMLTADGKICDNGATGYLLYDAQMPLDGVSNLLTTFLGANVACAQCHDHPLADWKQRDFYQMAAFFGASDGVDEKLLNAGKKLAKGGKGAPASGLPKGQVQVIASANAYRMVDTNKQSLNFPKDYKYSDVKPSSPVTPTLITWTKADKTNPAYRVNTANPVQLRAEFAKWMTHPNNPRFAANIANRVWKKVFGLAVQEPVSDLDDPTKASNPALLAHLATIIKAGRFDLREFQRVLFNSQTYQRAASVSPDLEKGPYLFPGPLVRRMTAEQVWDSLMVLSAGPEVDNILLRRGEHEKLMSLPGDATMENFKYVIDRMGGSSVAMGGGAKKKGGGSEKGLIAGYEGGKPQQRFGMILARASELPQPAAETHFLRLFGQSDRLIADTNTTDGSVPQALMLMNGGASKLITDTNCAAVTVAGSASSDDAKIDSLYLAFLARKPTAEERPAATQALTTGLGISDIAWALANTREFLFIQ
jgi:hypothetical protein